MVRCFPGSTSEDLKDYIKLLVKNIPVMVIIHVGTNDFINKIDNLTQVVNYVRIECMHKTG